MKFRRPTQPFGRCYSPQTGWVYLGTTPSKQRVQRICAAISQLTRRSLAEVAFLVLDEYQGKGVGTLLLKHLAILAKTRGIHVLRADVLADNQALLRVIEQSGCQLCARPHFGVV